MGASAWIAATAYPTASNSSSIAIKSLHVVTLTGAVSIAMDDLVIEAGATLSNTGGCHSWNDGAAAVDVRIFGTYTASSTCGGFGCCGVVHVENGGILNYNLRATYSDHWWCRPGGTVNGNTTTYAQSTIVNNGTGTWPPRATCAYLAHSPTSRTTAH
ncbi:MAG: hypothetical protein IPG92_18430 [Flavobacteriales bacterium]|nr:hypothetical protein [Flavobacteriales bacterium]